MRLEQVANLSQAIIAAFAVGGVFFAFLEYRKSLRAKRIDLAIEALRNWDTRIDEMTQPSLALLRENKDDEELVPNILNCQSIKLTGSDHSRQSYGFLIDGNKEIPASTVNEIRMSLVHYINAWETVAVLYNNGRADKAIIEAQLLTDRKPSQILSTVKPFMDAYGKDSWMPLRQMSEKLAKRAG